MADEVILLNCWSSPFGLRVKIALAEKGIEYEIKEENLANKSALLLKMNPVHKKIPVLIHNGKPVSESLVQVQYIDDVWKDKAPLFPSDPYQRAQARFWADYIDDKIFGIGRKIWVLKGAELEDARKEFIETLKVLEAEIGDKPYFLGDTFGYVDVTFVPLYSWLSVMETCADFSMEEECPKVLAWMKRCLKRESVFNCLPDQEEVFSFMLQLKRMLGIE